MDRVMAAIFITLLIAICMLPPLMIWTWSARAACADDFPGSSGCWNRFHVPTIEEGIAICRCPVGTDDR